jgi:hypothetical protein
MRGERRPEGDSERLNSLAETVFVTPPVPAASRFYLYTIKRHCWKSPLLVNKIAYLSSKQDLESQSGLAAERP